MTKEDLKKQRKALGLSVMEIAAKLGVHFQTAYKWESGKFPLPPLLERAMLQLQKELGGSEIGPTAAYKAASEIRISAYAEGYRDGCLEGEVKR
jgi:transcriptional regulator with XRE-family HTH domain